MTIGERIKIQRKKAQISQKELADKIGVSYVMISQYERGERNPKIGMLEKISQALNIDVNQLLPDEYSKSKLPPATKAIMMYDNKELSYQGDNNEAKQEFEEVIKFLKHNNLINKGDSYTQSIDGEFEVQSKLSMKYGDKYIVLDIDDIHYLYKELNSYFSYIFKKLLEEKAEKQDTQKEQP